MRGFCILPLLAALLILVSARSINKELIELTNNLNSRFEFEDSNDQEFFDVFGINTSSEEFYNGGQFEDYRNLYENDAKKAYQDEYDEVERAVGDMEFAEGFVKQNSFLYNNEANLHKTKEVIVGGNNVAHGKNVKNNNSEIAKDNDYKIDDNDTVGVKLYRLSGFGKTGDVLKKSDYDIDFHNEIGGKKNNNKNNNDRKDPYTKEDFDSDEEDADFVYKNAVNIDYNKDDRKDFSEEIKEDAGVERKELLKTDDAVEETIVDNDGLSEYNDETDDDRDNRVELEDETEDMDVENDDLSGYDDETEEDADEESEKPSEYDDYYDSDYNYNSKNLEGDNDYSGETDKLDDGNEEKGEKENEEDLDNKDYYDEFYKDDDEQQDVP